MITLLRRKFRSLSGDRRFSEILTGSAYALGARVLGAGMVLLSTVMVARYYGAEMTGILAMVNSVMMFATIFSVLGTNVSILRLIPEHSERFSVSSAFHVYRKTQYLVAAISVGVGVLLYWASPLLATTVFSKPPLAFYLALASGFVVCKSLMDLNIQATRGLKLVKAFAVFQVLPLAIMVLLLAALHRLRQLPNDPVYAQLAAWAITAAAGAWVMDRAFKKKMGGHDPISPVPVKEILSLSLPMLMTASMVFVLGQTGVILLGKIRTLSEVGHYSAALKLSTVTTFILQAINSIATPKFSELYASGNFDELFYVAQKSSKLIFWTTVPILVCLLVLGESILGLFFGREFTVGYLSLVFLVLGQFVNSASGATGNFMNMTGQQHVLKNITCVAAAINVALCLLLIPPFGMEGAAFAGMASLMVWNTATLWFIRMKHGRSIGYFPVFHG